MSQGILPGERALGEAVSTAMPTPSVGRCGFVLIAVIGALRTLGFARTLRLVRWMTRRVELSEAAPFDDAETVARRVALVAAFYPGRARCLEQSVTLYYLLRKLGISAAFRVGVQPIGFVAHAWVEYQGRPILETELVHTLLPFPAIPV